MGRIKNILVISPEYPYQGEPVYTFVQNLCNEFTRKGCNVIVIATQSITSAIKHHKIIKPRVRYELVGNNKITIYQPYTITFPYKYWKLYNFMTRLVATRFIKSLPIKPDVCYCHFWRSAYVILPYIQKSHIPLFVATGEGALSKKFAELSSPEYLQINHFLNGAISVSTNNKNISKEIGLLTGKDCIVLPNAIDQNIFYKKDRVALRAKYNYSKDDFIVAFVGSFNERKGSLRVSNAINRVGDIKSFFIGGQRESELADPMCSGILYKGEMEHGLIPDYLNMADIFVLPTLNEGCCNAIVEALACGLPIVSSDRPFNFDVLNGTNSILVNPMDIEAIANAISELKNNPIRRKQLSEGALRTAKELTINRRAQKILDFMEQHI